MKELLRALAAAVVVAGALGPAGAQEPAPEAPPGGDEPAPAAEPAPGADPDPAEPAASEPAPETGAAERRERADDEGFVPTEELGADEEVTFPVDI